MPVTALPVLLGSLVNQPRYDINRDVFVWPDGREVSAHQYYNSARIRHAVSQQQEQDEPLQPTSPYVRPVAKPKPAAPQVEDEFAWLKRRVREVCWFG